MPLTVENEIECLLGDNGLGDREGDADAERLGGEPGGVRRGVLVCDANNRPGDIRGLEVSDSASSECEYPPSVDWVR